MVGYCWKNNSQCFIFNEFELDLLESNMVFDDEGENSWEKEEMKFSEFPWKKCSLEVIFMKPKTRRYVVIFIKIMRKSWFWVKGYPFEWSENGHRFFHNLKIDVIKSWNVKNWNMFTKKYQVKWWFFIQIMIDFHKKRRYFREKIRENVGFGVKKCEKRFWMVKKYSESTREMKIKKSFFECSHKFFKTNFFLKICRKIGKKIENSRFFWWKSWKNVLDGLRRMWIH